MRAQKDELDIFADPSDASRLREKRRPRRNSESSVREKPSALDPEEEKKRRERKYRESKYSKGSKKPSKRLDLIDRLDVTSIYGTGREFVTISMTNLLLTVLQSSIMTAHLTPAILIETAKTPEQHPCKLSLKAP